jgi:hypothetical protein
MYIFTADPKPGDPDFWKFQQQKRKNTPSK